MKAKLNMNKVRIPEYRLPIFLIILSFIFNGCHPTDLEKSLKYANTNQGELEKVLEHYSIHEKDSLKKKAAIFLIQNMPGHYSYKGDEILQFYAQADSMLRNFPEVNRMRRPQLETLSTQLEELSGKYPHLSHHLVEDIHIITGDYLIKNIDNAFELWKDRLWAKHLNFDEFCEYILPYKVVELQQLDHWKDTLRGKFCENLSNEPLNDQYAYSAFHAALSINKELKEKASSFNSYNLIHYNGYKLLNSSTLYKMLFGECGDYSVLGVAVLRSEGIPVALDSNPRWGKKRHQHSWSMLYHNFGKTIPFHGALGLHPGDVFYPADPMPKVYRRTYAWNQRVKEHNEKALHLKSKFSVFTRDVTHEYMKTSDICIPLLKDVKDQYVYLSVFETRGWDIVDFGEIKKGNGVFSNVGRDILYVVQGYNGNNLVPVSDIFVVTSSGEVKFLKPNHSDLQTMRITRKNPLSFNLANMQSRILGGKIQASNHSDFSISETVCTIDSLLYPDLIPITIQQPYRYWRYVAADGTYGTIAELQFYPVNSDTEVKGNILGNHDLFDTHGNARKDKVFDGNWLTYSESS